MEQNFSFQGQQYQQKTERYPGKRYVMNTILPPGENQWTEPTPTDQHGLGFSANQGLEKFHHYYAMNTGIPGPYRPRPMKETETPAMKYNGVQQLFYDTQNVQYCSEDGKALPIPMPLAGDPIFEQYDVIGDKKENCGCSGGGGMLPFI